MKTRLSNSSHFNTPMAIKAQQTDQDNTPINAKDYRSIVGALFYLTHTRLDIVHAVNKDCQHV